MRLLRKYPFAIGLVVALVLIPLGMRWSVPSASARIVAGKCEVSVRIDGAQQWIEKSADFCVGLVSTATATAPATLAPATVAPAPTGTATAIRATATMNHPMPMPTSVATGWHAPTDHEHGDAPPAWVLTSPNKPFTQTRESHSGYKGSYAVSPGGAESYLITHIVSTVFARSHGDHDYQFWLRDPQSGFVAYAEGILDFGSPPPHRTSDTGERPIILSVGDGSCETWYARPGSAPFDLGWTICNRYAKFDGTVLGGNGAFRTADWIVSCKNFPPNNPLLKYCRTEFGVSRLSFIVNSKDYNAPGLTPGGN